MTVADDCVAAAEAAYRAGRFAEAAAMLEPLAETGPAHQAALRVLGMCRFRLGHAVPRHGTARSPAPASGGGSVPALHGTFAERGGTLGEPVGGVAGVGRLRRRDPRRAARPVARAQNGGGTLYAWAGLPGGRLCRTRHPVAARGHK